VSKLCRLEVNGNSISVRRGDLLLDAALLGGVEIPHDCRSGHCGTCRVRVLDGRVFGGKADADSVFACQARILSNARIALEEAPASTTLRGIVAAVTPLAADTSEVCIEVNEPAEYIAGQYYRVQFRGFPARCFSPTRPLDWPSNEAFLRFHIARVRGGRVSSQLGRRIRPGGRVTLMGPFGSAYLRNFHDRRLVLVASGTGFAPIWAIAEAAIRTEPRRQIMLVISVRNLASLYMIPALCRLALFPNVRIIPVASEHQEVTAAVREGRITDHLPDLTSNDIVFVAGAPGMVRAVARISESAGAICYSDPFEPAVRGMAGDLRWRAAGWLRSRAEMFSPYPPRVHSLIGT
jgi:3-phenylpropionate/trans-cinnamate dioxygenase ferredoxin reductase subunit